MLANRHKELRRSRKGAWVKFSLAFTEVALTAKPLRIGPQPPWFKTARAFAQCRQCAVPGTLVMPGTARCRAVFDQTGYQVCSVARKR